MKTKKIVIFVIIILLLIATNESVANNLKYNKSSIKINTENEKLWAVIITVGEPKRDNENAKDLFEILINNGWNHENILLLKEEEATKKEILSVPNWLELSGADENDLILFYFSMHGGRKEDAPPLDENDNLDEFVVSYEDNVEGDHILDDELSIMFDKIQSKNLVIIFETCYSGGMIDGESDLKKTGRIVITSTKEDETSYPIFLKNSWLFPFYLIRGLNGKADNNDDGFITAEEVYSYAKYYTMKRSTIYGYLLYIFHRSLFIQHPQMYDGWPSEENNEEELKIISYK